MGVLTFYGPFSSPRVRSVGSRTNLFGRKLDYAVSKQCSVELPARPRHPPTGGSLRGTARKTPQEPSLGRPLDCPPRLRDCFGTPSRPVPQLGRSLYLSPA